MQSFGLLPPEDSINLSLGQELCAVEGLSLILNKLPAIYTVRSSCCRPGCRISGRQFRFMSPAIVLFTELFCQMLSCHPYSYWLRSNLKHVGIGLPGCSGVEESG
ncbi:hypothetical protein MHYP_G00118690 [Metynnis hypsauchen]